MSKHLYLPSLEADANISLPDQSGLWEKKDRGIFLGISDGITISEAEEARGISSVPDIWARPLMFQSAIKPVAKNVHPLRKRVVREWRGLLSLLALSDLKNYPIQIVPVKLGDDIFSTALKSLAPKPVQLEQGQEYDWIDILLIRYDDIPIGAFSPTTLVYTATDYRDKLKKKDLSLIDDYGYLTEPGVEDLETVGKWLNELQHELKKIMFLDKSKNPDHNVVETIHDLISEWLKDIRKKLYDTEEDKKIESKDVAVSKDLLENLPAKTKEVVEKYRVYQRLLYPLTKAEEAEKLYHSDLSLALNLGKNRSQFKEVVIITSNLLGKNLKIWESIRLKDLGGDPQKCLESYFNNASGNRIAKKDISQAGAIWIRPEKYFLSDTLLKGKHGNFLMDNESEYNFGTRYVLPFKKEILDFFPIEHIKEVLKPTFKEEYDGVRFTFSLPIANGTDEKIEKFYKTKEIEASDNRVSEVEIPIIEIFPNYLDKHWRRYYILNEHTQNLQVNPVVYNDNKRITEPWPNRSHEVSTKDIRHKVTITEICSDNAFPEGLEIGNSRNEGEIFGLILISKPPEPREPDKTWKIGIDFGTSNTNVFRQSSTAETAEQWYFDFKKYIRRVSASNDEIRKQLLEMCFVPTDLIDLPIPTTLRIFTLARKSNLLLDYFIYFPTDYQTPHNVYSDIKWETENEKKTEYFIESLLFLILIEIVNERVQTVEFACSYPKAFSETSIVIFKGDWERILKKILDDNECVLKKHHSAADVGKLKLKGPFYEIEGLASGEYFASEKTIPEIRDRANKTIAAICLDVGGGTTDISIWHEDKIKSDASVLLAGRQISQFLQKNERVRELLFSPQGAVALEEKKNEPEFFAARLNVILKQEEARIEEMLLKHNNNSDIQWILKMLSIEFAAISFYTAMLAAATDRIIGGSVEQQKGILHRIATAGIGLHWGGNAAKFINWIDFGKYDKKGRACKILSAAFFNCLIDVDITAKSLSQLQSPGHKSEVSGGLVVMELEKRHLRAEEENDNEYVIKGLVMTEAKGTSIGIICGENIELTDKSLNYLDTISAKDLFDENSKTRFKSTSLDRLSRFIEIMNFFGIRSGLFTEDVKIKLTEQNKRLIKDEILSNFIKAQSLDEGQWVIEPIFIMEMRVLLEILRDELK